MKLIVLSGGAAHGLVDALAARFKAETGCEIDGTFGAVGGLRDRLVAGAPADLVILTRALIAELTHQGHVVPGTAADIGTVPTAVAVRSGDPAPALVDAAALRAALLAAAEIYCPDPGRKATAGIHFARVLDRLGIAAEVAPRLRLFPNGASAMHGLGAATSERPIGCTQATEILAVPGVKVAGPLPGDLGLATVYTAAVCTKAQLPEQARALAALLAKDEVRAARERAGFA
jgi:molybdate transport system substrate-binding protein